MLCGMVSPREAPRPDAAPKADGPSLVAVGIDGSDTAWHALAWACGHARRAGCPVLAVYVSTSGYWDRVIPNADASVAAATAADAAAQQLRAEVEQTTAGFGVRVNFVHRHGDPARELVTAAREHGADLLVVGTSAQLLHRVAGSLPGKLARCREMPLVVVP
jgi:nucleotide-binding universal stress UspA family protein